LDDARRDIGENALAQDLEHTSISEEARDGDVAALIERVPLRRVGLKPAAIVRKVVKSKFPDSSLQALADLTAHLSKARPAKVALRQCPLEKGGTIAIVHRLAN
jgi:hypothetical protein